MTTQPSAMPTNKLAVATIGNVTLNALMADAIREAWPSIVGPALSGPAMTAFIAAAIPALLSLAVAYFVPDRPNIPT